MLQLLLRNIRLNSKTGYYEANEAGSKYEIDTTLIDNLTDYLKNNPDKLIAHWYRQLEDFNLSKVNKISPL